MTPVQERLLLTVARILRARQREPWMPDWPQTHDDMVALDEALAPFSAQPGPAINEGGPPTNPCGFSDQTGICHWAGCNRTARCPTLRREGDQG